MSHLTLTKKELTWLVEHLKSVTEQYQEPDVCYEVLEKCQNMLTHHIRYENCVNWFNKLAADIEKTCVKSGGQDE